MLASRQDILACIRTRYGQGLIRYIKLVRLQAKEGHRCVQDAILLVTSPSLLIIEEQVEHKRNVMLLMPARMKKETGRSLKEGLGLFMDPALHGESSPSNNTLLQQLPDNTGG